MQPSADLFKEKKKNQKIVTGVSYGLQENQKFSLCQISEPSFLNTLNDLATETT